MSIPTGVAVRGSPRQPHLGASESGRPSPAGDSTGASVVDPEARFSVDQGSGYQQRFSVPLLQRTPLSWLSRGVHLALLGTNRVSRPSDTSATGQIACLLPGTALPNLERCLGHTAHRQLCAIPPFLLHYDAANQWPWLPLQNDE